MSWDGHETWYSVVGDLDAGPTPVVICHGGPGAAHDYVEPIADLSRFGRGVRALRPARLRQERRTCPTRRPTSGRRSSSRTSSSLLARRARDRRPVRRRRPVVGRHARDGVRARPSGRACAAIVVADSPASIPLWVEEANRLRRDLPPDVQETLTRHEAAGTTDDPEYEAAVRVFYDRHLCRVVRGPTTSSGASRRSPPTRPSTTR